MEIMTNKTMTGQELLQFQDENGELIDKIGMEKSRMRDLSIEIPDYSSIDGVNCATVKLGSRRRKT